MAQFANKIWVNRIQIRRIVPVRASPRPNGALVARAVRRRAFANPRSVRDEALEMVKPTALFGSIVPPARLLAEDLPHSDQVPMELSWQFHGQLIGFCPDRPECSACHVELPEVARRRDRAWDDYRGTGKPGRGWSAVGGTSTGVERCAGQPR